MKQSFLLRLPTDQLTKLQKRASQTGESLNKYLNSLISKNLSGFYEDTHKNELIEIIKKSSLVQNLEAILLFGSVAKGLDTEQSDMDILLVLSEDSKISRKLYTIWDEEVADKMNPSLSGGKEVSPHFVKLPTNINSIHGLWLEVAISGLVLWKNSSKIETALQEIRLAIANGLFIRKETHGHPYWRKLNQENQL